MLLKEHVGYLTTVCILSKDQACSNTRVPTTQHESTRAQHEPTQINTSPTRVNTNLN